MDPFTVSLGLEGVFRRRDRVDDEPIANTGSSFWFVTPEVSFRVTSSVRVYLRASLPIYRNVVKTQSVHGELWSIGLLWTI